MIDASVLAVTRSINEVASVRFVARAVLVSALHAVWCPLALPCGARANYELTAE